MRDRQLFPYEPGTAPSGGGGGALAGDFNFSADNGLAVDFFSVASGGTAPYTYAWSFGDTNTSTAEDPTHTYGSDNTYTVNLTITDSAAANVVISKSVTVAAVVVPITGDFAFNAVGLDIAPEAIFSGGTGPYTYAWNFGDTNTSTAANPTHTYAAAGTYTTTLVVTDSLGATQTFSNTITVGAVVTPLLADAFVETEGFEAKYHLIVTGGTAPYTYAWDFKEGNTSTDQEPLHTFGSVGTYAADCVITDAAGVAQTTTVIVTTEIDGIIPQKLSCFEAGMSFIFALHNDHDHDVTQDTYNVEPGMTMMP